MSKKVTISPSLLSSDFSCLGKELELLSASGLSWVHFDIMDGNFVPNITFGAGVVKALRKNSSLFFDCHLMVAQPERYIDDFANAGADLIAIHAEATTHLERVIQQIKSHGIKAGVAINPATSLSVLDYILPELDQVLIMSVNPGFGGQKFISSALQKISDLRKRAEKENPSLIIEVDGGVHLENCHDIISAGADTLVSGAAFFNAPCYKTRLEEFNNACQKK